MDPRKETGAEELRRVCAALGYNNESALDPYSAEDLLHIMRAIAAGGWDIFVDQLLPEERDHAAMHGTLSSACLARLQKRFG